MRTLLFTGKGGVGKTTVAAATALADVKAHHDSGRYDLLVVDCAPTAETLRLLALPDVLTRFMERAFPVGRQLVKTVRPMLTRVTTMPVADDAVLGALQRMWERL